MCLFYTISYLLLWNIDVHSIIPQIAELLRANEVSMEFVIHETGFGKFFPKSGNHC